MLVAPIENDNYFVLDKVSFHLSLRKFILDNYLKE